MKTKLNYKKSMFLLAMILTGTLAFGQPGPGYGQRKMGGPKTHTQVQPGMHMAAFLDLTEDQQKQITDLRNSHLKEVLPLKNKLAELRTQYHTLITAESPDQKAIEKNIDAQTDLQNKLKKSAADFQLRFRKVLTEEQRLILDAHAGRRGFGRMGAKDFGPGRGRCGNFAGRGFHRMNF